MASKSPSLALYTWNWGWDCEVRVRVRFTVRIRVRIRVRVRVRVGPYVRRMLPLLEDNKSGSSGSTGVDAPPGLAPAALRSSAPATDDAGTCGGTAVRSKASGGAVRTLSIENQFASFAQNYPKPDLSAPSSTSGRALLRGRD